MLYKISELCERTGGKYMMRTNIKKHPFGLDPAIPEVLSRYQCCNLQHLLNLVGNMSPQQDVGLHKALLLVPDLVMPYMYITSDYFRREFLHATRESTNT